MIILVTQLTSLFLRPQNEGLYRLRIHYRHPFINIALFNTPLLHQYEIGDKMGILVTIPSLILIK